MRDQFAGKHDPTFDGCNELELMWHQLQEKYRNNQPMLALLGET
nr:hypothetical protein [Pseudomonas asturiensis]